MWFFFPKPRLQPKKKKYSAKDKYETGLLICQNKRPFKTKRSAWDFAVNWSKIKGTPMSAYKCRYCKDYHLTSRPGNFPPKNFL